MGPILPPSSTMQLASRDNELLLLLDSATMLITLPMFLKIATFYDIIMLEEWADMVQVTAPWWGMVCPVSSVPIIINNLNQHFNIHAARQHSQHSCRHWRLNDPEIKYLELWELIESTNNLRLKAFWYLITRTGDTVGRVAAKSDSRCCWFISSIIMLQFVRAGSEVRKLRNWSANDGLVDRSTGVNWSWSGLVMYHYWAAIS